MNQFTFRLQSVIQIRARARDAASHAYQKALQARAKLDDQISELNAEHDSQQPFQQASSLKQVNPQRLLESQRYQMMLQQDIAGLRSKRAVIEEECERRRLALVEREKAVRAIEKLREKRLAEWQVSELAKQQIAMDQWSGFRYWDKQP